MKCFQVVYLKGESFRPLNKSNDKSDDLTAEKEKLIKNGSLRFWNISQPLHYVGC